MDYTDKNGNFINYYNFINDLDSFNDSFMKDVIKCYFEYIDQVCYRFFLGFGIIIYRYPLKYHIITVISVI